MKTKTRLPYLALLVALPSLVCASSYTHFAKEVEFVAANSKERSVTPQTYSYDLVWNSMAGKFDAHMVMKGDSLIIEQPLESPAPSISNRALAI